MKRKGFFGLLLLAAALLLLAGCEAAFDPRQLMERYASGSLRAEYGVTTHASFCVEYQLSCRMEGDTATVTILQPQSVAGVTAVLRRGEARLQYEDLSLDALLPEYPGYSPMDVLPRLLEEIGSRQPASYVMEDGCWVVEYRSAQDQTELLKRVAFARETLELTSAELYLDGSLILTVAPQSFQWTPEAP